MSTSCFQKVLLIDDDSVANHINKFMIERSKFATDIKALISPIDGLELLNPNEKEHESFDVIFLDLNMPKMNGWQFLEEFSKFNMPDPRPYIIMLTSSVNPDDHKRAGEIESIHSIISKPLTSDILQSLAKSLCND